MQNARILFVALIGLAITGQKAFALPDELEVHLDDITKTGEFALDTITSYTVSGPRTAADNGLRPTRHLIQVSPDISYGFSKNSQFDLQLFSSVALSGETRIDGARVEALTIPIRPEDEDDDGLFLGGLFEVGHLPATLSTNNLDAEIKLILGYRLGRWVFATNPEIGFKVSGSGSGASPDLSTKVKIAYRAGESYSIGIEQYSELGQLRQIGPLNQQSQQTFAVVDFKHGDKDFNIGVGRGWNDYSCLLYTSPSPRD